MQDWFLIGSTVVLFMMSWTPFSLIIWRSWVRLKGIVNSSAENGHCLDEVLTEDEMMGSIQVALVQCHSLRVLFNFCGEG